MSSEVLYRVVSRFLARPVERKCYSAEQEDSLRLLFEAIVYSESWVRKTVKSGVHDGFSEFGVQRYFECSADFSRTGRVSRRSAVAFGKQMLREPSLSVIIGRIRCEYETVPSRFQRLNITCAGIITVSNYYINS